MNKNKKSKLEGLSLGDIQVIYSKMDNSNLIDELKAYEFFNETQKDPYKILENEIESRINYGFSHLKPYEEKCVKVVNYSKEEGISPSSQLLPKRGILKKAYFPKPVEVPNKGGGKIGIDFAKNSQVNAIYNSMYKKGCETIQKIKNLDF
ncbi:hypothetical protein GW932_03245 [archaeon]|nr:hypothetical protein [archaeon]